MYIPSSFVSSNKTRQDSITPLFSKHGGGGAESNKMLTFQSWSSWLWLESKTYDLFCIINYPEGFINIVLEIVCGQGVQILFFGSIIEKSAIDNYLKY